MGYNSPKELTAAYSSAGAAKAKKSAADLLVLGILAGALIALGCAATNTAAHGVADVGLARMICGLLFPFGLCMVIVTGAELFTGNSLIVISVLDRKASFAGMLRNWLLVYLGNFIGAALVAWSCAAFGQLNYSGGQLAVYTIRIAAAKCAIPFANGVGLGIFCNVLVCLGVLMAMAAKDAAGRLLGAFIPVSYFVICGFEHCVANMYYISAGLFAAANPAYAALATQAGIDLSVLTVSNFLVTNLIPVTLGNIIGGAAMGATMWFAYLRHERT
ncbi:MAG: formate/nitrite transporter family protein [Clostridia bacterium]|nr:formate/nitrite transporter family protein [Clostridia bacterium]